MRPESMRRDSQPGSWLGRWAGALIPWATAGLLASGQFALATASLGHEIRWLDVIVWELPVWLFWGLVTPLISRICRRFTLDRDLHVAIPVHLAAGAIVSLAYVAFWMLWNEAFSPYAVGGTRPLGDVFWTYLRARFTMAVLLYWAIAGGWHAIAYYRSRREGLLEAAALRRELAEARLQALEQRIRPHFLFNSLNTVAALLESDPAAARRVVANLGDLLRDSLKDAGGITSLEAEIEFVRRYLEIEQIRFEERLRVHWQIDPAALDARVPRFLLQPLAENAIRHGIAQLEQGGEVAIEVTRHGERISIVILNDCPTEPTGGNDVRREEPRLGLASTRSRLFVSYGADHGFEVRQAGSGRTEVHLQLPADIAC